MSSGLRRRYGSGTSKGSKATHREMKELICLVNKYLLGPVETMGPKKDFDQVGLAR